MRTLGGRWELGREKQRFLREAKHQVCSAAQITVAAVFFENPCSGRAEQTAASGCCVLVQLQFLCLVHHPALSTDLLRNLLFNV